MLFGSLNTLIISQVVALAAAFDVVEDLTSLLSDRAKVTTNISTAPRWSEYHAPRPGFIVNVAEELDVAKTIRYCNDHDMKFLAQAGGNGWADTFDLGDYGVIIDLRGLNSIVFDDEEETVTLGGGTINGEWIDASLAHGKQALNGGCNCVGVLGSTLGGGVSRWMGLYGMPIDNVLSANLVTADGELITLSPTSHPDLLWAILGAGPNFGIVTSVTMNTFPLIDGGVIWAGELIFSGDKLEPLIVALNNLHLTAEMSLLWGFSFRETGPVITAQVSYTSSDPQAGRDAFRTLYDVGPDDDTTELLEYDHINDDTEFLCEDGGRKPGWFTGLRTFDYSTFQVIWDEFVTFVNDTGLDGTTILIECYSNDVLREIGSEHASYAHREIDYYAWILFGYEGKESDALAEGFGERVRALWREASGFEEQQRTYINFAHGDESSEEIYGESLPRLRELKQEWDLCGKFDQWFPIH